MPKVIADDRLGTPAVTSNVQVITLFEMVVIVILRPRYGYRLTVSLWNPTISPTTGVGVRVLQLPELSPLAGLVKVATPLATVIVMPAGAAILPPWEFPIRYVRIDVRATDITSYNEWV